MSGETEISDVKWGGLYRDDSCGALEVTLRDDPNYRECTVERLRCLEDIGNNPYMVKDEDGKEILVLEKWQIDTLNSSELISYIKVQQKRDQCVDRSESVAFYVLFASFLWGTAFSVFTVVDIILSYPPRVDNYQMALVSFPVMIVSGIVYFSKHKNSYLEKRKVDLEAARIDSSFLSGLRKLAEVPKSEYEFVYNDEHIMRLRHIENAMAGTNS
ncbi:MAG: hypothetical protein EAX87_14395 [Candidatus Thorarchaeota archaeon]|nr:hypothetical protein [Candidatus Thorarchaeota archaeon]